jgi:hypothetical protein
MKEFSVSASAAANPLHDYCITPVQYHRALGDLASKSHFPGLLGFVRCSQLLVYISAALDNHSMC